MKKPSDKAWFFYAKVNYTKGEILIKRTSIFVSFPRCFFNHKKDY